MAGCSNLAKKREMQHARERWSGKRPPDLLVRARKLWLERLPPSSLNVRFSGNLAASPIPSSTRGASITTAATLTKEAFLWGSLCIRLKDVVAVSYCGASKRLTIHSYGVFVTRWVPGLFGAARRRRRDLHFTAPETHSLLQWISAFEKEGCFVNGLPHVASPLEEASGKTNLGEPISDMSADARPYRSILVILNPCAGHGRARSIFYDKVHPLFKLSGFKMEVVETMKTRHAQNLAATLNLRDYPYGIVCIGGDGIVNEVLNGLFNRDDSTQAMKVPVGIIPAGSDNSLVWTVLGVQDPISAAISIIKDTGDAQLEREMAKEAQRQEQENIDMKARISTLENMGKTVYMDVFVAKWIQSGTTHMGHTIVYHGFMSDVLKDSARYQERFGPFRYFIAGFLRFLHLPKFEIEIHYLPVMGDNCKISHVHCRQASLYSGRPYVSCKTLGDHMGHRANTSWLNAQSECKHEEILQKSIIGKNLERTQFPMSNACQRGCTVLTKTSDDNTPSTMLDTAKQTDGHKGREHAKSAIISPVVRKGYFLGLMICNHRCKASQCLKSQVLAPLAEHDDGTLDLMLVHCISRLQLFFFLVLMQFNRHLSLPFVEYTKVQEVMIIPGSKSHQGYGVDGELLVLNGPLHVSLHGHKFLLIGTTRNS